MGAELVAETFPNYRYVLRKLGEIGESVDVIVDATDLFDAIEDVTDVEGCCVAVKIQKGKITIFSPDGAASVACTTPPGWKSLKIGFNRNYLLDILEGLRGTSVTLHLVPTAGIQPVSFETAAIPGLLYVVMPMNL